MVSKLWFKLVICLDTTKEIFLGKIEKVFEAHKNSGDLSCLVTNNNIFSWPVELAPSEAGLVSLADFLAEIPVGETG